MPKKTIEQKAIEASPPDWLLKREGLTKRQWKSRKRQGLKKVLRALEEYRHGCAYCPGHDSEFATIERALRKLEWLHSIKIWGR